MRAAVFFLALLLAAPAVAQQDTPLPDAAQEAQALAVMREVRCLVCEGQSIADSGAEMAVDLRALVRTRIARGDSPVMIKDDLRSRYGDSILLRPPVNAQTGLLWAMPVLLLAFGAVIARSLFVRQPK